MYITEVTSSGQLAGVQTRERACRADVCQNRGGGGCRSHLRISIRRISRYMNEFDKVKSNTAFLQLHSSVRCFRWESVIFVARSQEDFEKMQTIADVNFTVTIYKRSFGPRLRTQ